MARYVRGFDVEVACAHLRRVDRRFAVWMKRLPPVLPERGWRRSFDPVDALARAIIYQQLSGKAASTIVGRVENAVDDRRLHHEALRRVDDAGLRICGVSRNKIAALRDLSARAERGEIPSVRHMANMHHDAIIEALTQVRGIGRWTVEMMLIFRLGRPDILPVDDLGVRKGAQYLDDGDIPYTAKALSVRGECWSPYRTYASLCLWRIADFKASAREPVLRSQD
ncbi:MAG: DNA-3-methyladenine glycosylase 2 family protein [Xanthomonadaceae bacterium]|jgi:DNA-3-methyladenine glycosylase II|nr:DNA-3-methyladenine glycosylase 2 family protein [Xanthomonadaceae bacterium]